MVWIDLLVWVLASITTQITKRFGVPTQLVVLGYAVIGAIWYFIWTYYSTDVNPAKAQELIKFWAIVFTTAIAFYEVLLKRIINYGKIEDSTAK